MNWTREDFAFLVLTGGCAIAALLVLFIFVRDGHWAAFLVALYGARIAGVGIEGWSEHRATRWSA